MTVSTVTKFSYYQGPSPQGKPPGAMVDMTEFLQRQGERYEKALAEITKVIQEIQQTSPTPTNAPANESVMDRVD